MCRLQPLQIEQTETMLNRKSVKYPLLSEFSRFTARCLLFCIAGESSLDRRMLLETCCPHKTNNLTSNNTKSAAQKWIFPRFLNQHSFSLLDLKRLKVAHGENLRGSSEGTLVTHHTKFSARSDHW